MLGYAGDWITLADFLPDDWKADPVRRRSATAAHFAASLELAKQGMITLSQTDTFAPLRLRVKPA
jgi:segregation and condensation protein A